MAHKTIIALIALIAGYGISDAQILNSVSHSKITQKVEVPFKYFFYAAAEGGYWHDTSSNGNGVFGGLFGFKHRLKNSNFFAGALLDIESYKDGECSICAFVEPTISYIRKVDSLTDRTIDATLGCGVGYYEYGAIMPEFNLTYWFSIVGIGGTARFVVPMTGHTTANYNLMARIAIRF